MTDTNHADEVNDRFRRNLKSFREQAGWNQPELARKMVAQGWPTYSQMTVKRTEEGDRAVPLAEAVGLAEVFGVKMDALLLTREAEQSFAKVRRSLLELKEARRNLKASYRLWYEARINASWIKSTADRANFGGADLDRVLRFNLDQLELGEMTAETAQAIIREVDTEMGVGDDDGEHPEDD